MPHPKRPPSPADGGQDLFTLERQCAGRGAQHIAGVDEAGRGPLAGPVVAAAVVFPIELVRQGLPPALQGLTDSKQLTAPQRRRFDAALRALPGLRYGLHTVDVETIDALNILQATHRAMREALLALDPAPDAILVDGLTVPDLGFTHTAVVHGDALSFSIAAASVLAKVARDQLMEDFDRQYPHYGFARHKGYGTPQHLEALAKFGPCPLHRSSFAPVRDTQLALFQIPPRHWSP